VLLVAGAAAAAPPAQPRLTLPDPLPTRTVRVPILMYHRIAESPPSLPEVTRRLSVDPAMFAREMTWLKLHGRHTITQRQLFDALMLGSPLPARPVLITFDDGYRGVYTHAEPVLARLGLHATAYVITSRISGPDPSFLTWRQLEKLEGVGVEIGSHTISHADLTTLSDAQALAELVGARRALEQHLGHPVQWLSYPGGSENAHVVALSRRAGYVLAVTTQPGSLQHADQPLELRRYRILDTTGVAGLAALLRS
jgi:peptidoglycan/xylan/chitin deacetylase (PgdA/CDA1 family)